MRVAICDDCLADRRKLRTLIEAYSRTGGASLEVEEYSSGVELCSDMSRLSGYGIIFVDIGMEELDGLETTRKIKALYPELPIVLVTEVMGYALEGYRVNASRFLIKKDLERTLNRCLDEILEERRRKKQTVTFPFVEGSKTLEIQKLIYVETARHKNLFHTANETYSLYRKLDEIEELLGEYGFLRIHQSYLVNMRYIEKISSYVMRLTTGQELSVPKSRYPYVKKAFALFHKVV